MRKSKAMPKFDVQYYTNQPGVYKSRIMVYNNATDLEEMLHDGEPWRSATIHSITQTYSYD
jgi:hypothetical protein